MQPLQLGIPLVKGDDNVIGGILLLQKGGDFLLDFIFSHRSSTKVESHIKDNVGVGMAGNNTDIVNILDTRHILCKSDKV